jgi:hypothetical protein
MKKLFLAAGVAALAITAPAFADPGKNDRGKGRDRGAKIERGGGGERAQKMREKRSEAAGKSRQQRAERAGKAREQRAERAKKANESARKVREQRAERANKARERNLEQAQKRNERSFEARNRLAEQREKAFEKRSNRQERLADRRRDRRDDDRFRDFDGDRFDRRFAERGRAGFANDCPPGLSKAPGVCMPWGQYKKQLIGQRLPSQFRAQVLPTRLRDLYRDTDDFYYRYGNGNLYRVDRNQQLIRSVLPLIGAGLGIGMPFPYNSPRYQVPSAYQPFYRNTSDDYYRYANGYVYEVDRNSGLIENMIPLLDQGYGVGQMLPESYSYYNLPYQYRSHYRDDDDYLYRYAPGAIYQVDRKTQLITSIASLLTGTNNGLAVGQPLPMGYDAYNVPYQYRDRYNDTPDSWYRYSNGSIYQVDPTTRLVTALINAIV